VAYNYAAAQMHIIDGETGVLAPYGDDPAFVNAAVRLACDAHLLHKVRWQARADATHIDWPCVVERFESLLIHAMPQ